MKTTIQPTIAQLRMLADIRGNQWMIREDSIQSFALAALEVKETDPTSDEEDDYWENFYDVRRPMYVDSDKVAHIEIKGSLMAKIGKFYEKIGLATRYQTIIDESEAAIRAGAAAILYHVNSPGGTVSGNVEAAKFISSLPVPTAAHCVGLACSAAYKLAAGMGEIHASPSAQVGNIGTILSWADCTGFWAEMGIEFKALTNAGADLKSTFHVEPDDAQIEFLQAQIDEMGEQFRDHVIEGRKNAGAKLDPEVFRAGWYSGEAALRLGLIDGIGDAESARLSIAPKRSKFAFA